MTLALAASTAAAAGAGLDVLDRETPTVYLDTTGGYSIYKSQMVKSNDTSTTVAYGFGVNAGLEKKLHFGVNRELSTFGFNLTQSALKISWQDTTFGYRWGPVYFGAVLTNSTWLGSRPDIADDGTVSGTAADFLNITTTGYGGNVGALIPTSAHSYAYIDVLYSTANQVQQKASETDFAAATTPPVVTLGPRMALDLGASFDLTKQLVDGLIGFKYRTYQVSVGGTNYAEQHHTTYLGLRFNWNL